MATRSPLPASTWRSRQLYATLSLPPTNHLANGRSHSRIVCHSLVQSSASACAAQNPCQSRSASSYTDASVSSAVLRNDSGGGNVRPSCSSASSASPSLMLPPSLSVRGQAIECLAGEGQDAMGAEAGGI